MWTDHSPRNLLWTAGLVVEKAEGRERIQSQSAARSGGSRSASASCAGERRAALSSIVHHAGADGRVVTEDLNEMLTIFLRADQDLRRSYPLALKSPTGQP